LLRRLLALNLEIAATEAAGTAHELEDSDFTRETDVGIAYRKVRPTL
jgi:hypothetical protein